MPVALWRRAQRWQRWCPRVYPQQQPAQRGSQRRSLRSRGCSFFAAWQVDASQNGTPIHLLDKPATVVIPVANLLAQGIDPAMLHLWTRTDASDFWRREPAYYNAELQQLIVQLSHFSQFGLGSGLTRGEILPSANGFKSDRTTGAATIHYPIEAPSGLGGLTPNLSLNYSSAYVDDILNSLGNVNLHEGNEKYAVQGSTVGWGWSVNGLSYVERSNTVPGHDFYSMVLNGRSVKILQGQQQTNTDFRTYPELFAKVNYMTSYGSESNFSGWQVKTPDGMTYIFGGQALNVTASGAITTNENIQWPTTQPSKNTPLSMALERNDVNSVNSPFSYIVRAYNRWQLSAVIDPLGNRMTYSYSAERGAVGANCAGNSTDISGTPSRLWYTRALLPTQIDWSGNPGQGASEMLRVRFVYAGGRTDANIEGTNPGECAEVTYTDKKLTGVIVEVKESTGSNWHILHEYSLTQLYDSGRAMANHLLLNQIKQYGKGGNSGSLLNTYAFTYKAILPDSGGERIPGHANDTRNNVRLQTADNGWGGVAAYTYTQKTVTFCNAGCGGGETPPYNRYPVTSFTLDDGLNNRTRSDYSYTDGALHIEFDTYKNANNVDVSVVRYREFEGFQKSNGTYYALYPKNGSVGAVVKKDYMEFWQQNATESPDPNLTKLKRYKVMAANNSVLADTRYTYSAWTQSTSNQHNWNVAWVAGNYGSKASWGRLDEVNEWTAGNGKLTKYFYETANQSGKQYGNVTKAEEYGHSEASLPIGGETTPAANTWNHRVKNSLVTKLRSTTTDYFPNDTATVWIVNKPARVRVYDGTTCMSEVRTIYDDNVNGVYTTPPSKGLLAKTQRALTACSDTAPLASNDTAWQEDRMAYDVYGNNVVLHHLAGGTAQDEWINTTWDSTYHLFPTQQQQTPSTYAETASYFGVNESRVALSNAKAYWGAMSEYCAVNDLCTLQSYDSFGRAVRKWDAIAEGTTGWPANSAAQTVWSYNAPKSAHASQLTFVVIEQHSPRCAGNFVRKHYNGLGQLVQEQRPQATWTINTADDCTGVRNISPEVDVNYAYNGLGQQIYASVPLVGDGNLWYSRLPTDWSTVAKSTTSYDPIGRPLQITSPNGENQYFGYAARAMHHYGRERTLATTVAAAYKTLDWQDKDALGNLKTTSIWQWSGTGWGAAAVNSVSLSHDVLGNLTSTSNSASGASSSMTYDKAGRKTAMTDADLGSWGYDYDRQGKLTRQTDARGKTTCLYYENALFRLAGKHLRTTTACPAVTGYSNTHMPQLGNSEILQTTYSYDE